MKKETPILLHITSFVWYLILLYSQNSKKLLFRGWHSLIYPFRGSDPMCDFNIFKLHQNEDLFKKLEVSILKNMDRILKKTFFRGWYPLIYPLQGSDPMCDFNIFKLHQNKDLSRILKKPVFRGGPLNYPLQGVTP